jgi:hypothetical protein
MSVIVPKQILAPGRYWAQHRLTGETLPVEFTDDDCRKFFETGTAMLAHGWAPPLPLEHQVEADPLPFDEALARSVSHNTGRARRYWIDPEDNSLWADLEFAWLPDTPEDQIEKALKERIQFVSPDLHPELTLGDGTVWKHAIRHIALTPTPIDFRQKPFGTSINPTTPVPMSMVGVVPVWRWAQAPVPVAMSMCNRIADDDEDHPVSLSLYPRPSQASKRFTRPASLSQGASAMAKEEGEPEGKDEDPFTQEELETPPTEEPPPTPEPEANGACAAKIAKVSGALANMGIMVDASRGPEDFLDHLCTAIDTHLATKGNEEPEEPETEPMAPKKPDPAALARPEPEVVSMSMFKQQGREVADLKAQLASDRLSVKLREIDQLEKAGVKAERCKKWRETLTGKQLSLATKTVVDPAVTQVLAEMEAMKEAFADKIQMSLAREENEPDWARWNPKKEDAEKTRQAQEDAGDELAALAGAPCKKK